MKTVYFCRLFVTYVDVSYISWQVETVDAKKKNDVTHLDICTARRRKNVTCPGKMKWHNMNHRA